MSVHNSDNGDDYVEDPVTLISKLDISDPMHLHPNDSTALIVVSIKLKGAENYQVRSCAMLLALEGKNKTGFIDGSCKRSNTDEFLMGLDDSYMQISSSFLSREVLSDVKRAYATISSEESHRVVSGRIVDSSQRNQAFDFVSNVPNINNFQRNNQNFNSVHRPNNLNNNRQGGGSALIYENCGFNGHSIDRCFKIIGYPADFGKKKSGENFKGKKVSNNNSVGTSSSSRSEKCVMMGNSNYKKGYRLYSLDRNQFIFSRDVKFFEFVFPFKDSASKEVDTSNVFQDLNHTNLFDIKYLEMPCDDERVDPKLNSDQKSQSDSSHSSESGRNMNTIDFIDDKYVNDAQSNDDIFATQDEQSDKGVFLALLVYVDDISLMGNKFYEINKFKVYQSLHNKEKYVLDLLSEYGMLACKPAKTPLMSNLIISNEATENDPILDNITDYQKLMDLEIDNLLSVALHCDINSVIKIAVNPVFYERTKHLEIDLHFVREKILKGFVKIVKVESAYQIADILTKGLDTVQHKELVKKLEMFDIYQVWLEENKD
ncbi:ribonuclease H-like domain-containing protein [Tanacetum coccineum]